MNTYTGCGVSSLALLSRPSRLTVPKRGDPYVFESQANSEFSSDNLFPVIIIKGEIGKATLGGFATFDGATCNFEIEMNERMDNGRCALSR